MFQDDRMISVLSAIVLMVAIGTVIQRADLLSDSADDETRVVLSTDIVEARANRLLRIDVLQNDVGVANADRERLAVLRQPACGQVFVQGDALQYLPDPSCVGQQIIQYGIAGRDDVVGQVVAQVSAVPGMVVAAAQPKALQQPQAQPEASGKPTDARPAVKAPVTTNAAAETETTATQPEQQAEPAIAPGTETPASVPSVVDTLIAGAAQPAEAAVSEPLRRTTASETDAARVAKAPAANLAEPSPVRAPSVTLGVPAQPSEQSDVAAGVQTSAVTRSGLGARVSESDVPTNASVEKPTIRLATPNLDVRAPDAQPEVAVQDRFELAAIETTDRNPDRTPPVNGGGDIEGEDDTGFLIAIVSRKEPNTQAPKGLSVVPAREVPLKSVSNRDAAARDDAGGQITVAALPQAITTPQDVPRTALDASPVDVTQPLPGPAPVLTSVQPPVRPTTTAAIDAATDQLTTTQPSGVSSDRSAPRTPAAPESDQLAALPRHDAPCVVPPAMTIDVRRAARSIISVDAPCHSDTVAELEYSGMRVAVPLDQKGRGAKEILGFEPNAPAVLTFVNGEKIDFDLPFKGIGRVSRVALVWDMPVHLELNAIEFGAELGSSEHVRPDNPRSFQDVRRSGGGFLDSYRSYAGIGQNAQIYSFYHRRGGQQGVVELMIDYASRNRDLLDGTCGDGKYAAPNFLVLRSIDARLERPIIRKLAALSCSSVTEEKGDKRLISGAVGDLLVVQK